MTQPVRIICRPGHYYLEIRLDGKTTNIDLSHYSPANLTKVAHAIFAWRKSGYKGWLELPT